MIKSYIITSFSSRFSPVLVTSLKKCLYLCLCLCSYLCFEVGVAHVENAPGQCQCKLIEPHSHRNNENRSPECLTVKLFINKYIFPYLSLILLWLKVLKGFRWQTLYVQTSYVQALYFRKISLHDKSVLEKVGVWIKCWIEFVSYPNYHLSRATYYVSTFAVSLKCTFLVGLVY